MTDKNKMAKGQKDRRLKKEQSSIDNSQ